MERFLCKGEAESNRVFQHLVVAAFPSPSTRSKHEANKQKGTVTRLNPSLPPSEASANRVYNNPLSLTGGFLFFRISV